MTSSRLAAAPLQTLHRNVADTPSFLSQTREISPREFASSLRERRFRHDVGVIGDEFGRARHWIAAADRITVFTGAGISTDSGIPDFRGPNGLWTKNPAAEKASTLQNYLADADVRRFAWQNRLHSPAWTAEPNSGHMAIYELERQGRLRAVVTQNIDELHQRAGHGANKVIEVHGTMRWTRCWTCDDRRPMQESLERVRRGEDDPHCLVCGVGVLKSDTISFGQTLVPEVIDAAMQAADECDLLLAAGSTLSVFPAANVVPRAKTHGARIVIVNGEPTAMDRYADDLLIGSLGDLLPALIGSARD
jgi:NAD-dependent deacetylase